MGGNKMKRKTKVEVYVFSGNATGNVIIEIDAIEDGDLKKEAVFLHHVLFDNLPEETYDELVKRIKEENE
jgi:hypothetical protein